MAPVDAAPLVEHVVGLGGFRVRGPVGVDVGAHVGEQVGALARLGHRGAQPRERVPVVEQGFAVAGKVVLFQRGGREEGFAVQEAGELGDEGFALIEERK